MSAMIKNETLFHLFGLLRQMTTGMASEDDLQKILESAFDAGALSANDSECMTLRDQFAAKVMPELVRVVYDGDGKYSVEKMLSVAREAYQWADAMLEARKV